MQNSDTEGELGQKGKDTRLLSDQFFRKIAWKSNNFLPKEGMHILVSQMARKELLGPLMVSRDVEPSWTTIKSGQTQPNLICNEDIIYISMCFFFFLCVCFFT